MADRHISKLSTKWLKLCIDTCLKKSEYHQISSIIQNNASFRNDVSLSKKVLTPVLRYFSSSAKDAIGPVRYSKIVHTGDTQMLQMVQGGLILELLEAAADVAAVKHTNKFSKQKNQFPALVGIERVEMRSTAKVGDLMEFIAEVIDFKPHSIRCMVSVYQRSYELKEKSQLMVRSWMWYVPLIKEGVVGSFSSEQSILPQKETLMKPQLRKRYFNRLAKRKDPKYEAHLEDIKDFLMTQASNVSQIPLSTSYVIKASDCGSHGFSKSGPLLRWIDEFAGCLAISIVGVPCVTGSIDSFTFNKSLPQGSCITFIGRPVFYSRRTIDLQILGCIDSKGGLKQEIFAEAFLTFVSLNMDDSEFRIPDIDLSNVDKDIYEERKMIYVARKAAIAREKFDPKSLIKIDS